MAYGIVYDSVNAQDKRKHILRRTCLSVVFIFLFICLVSAFWPNGMTLMKALLCTVNMDTTVQAVEVFAMELTSGFSVSDALENFAETIQKNGYEH